MLLGLLLGAVLLGGCEQLGIPDFTKSSASAEADGKATGAACRHAGRAIEDCYNLNPGAQRAAVFAGWREMNDYMAEKNIAEVEPKVPPPPPPRKSPPPSPSAALKPRRRSPRPKTPRRHRRPRKAPRSPLRRANGVAAASKPGRAVV